jgi:hypothetical protein
MASFSDLFCSRAALQLEILALRHQIGIPVLSISEMSSRNEISKIAEVNPNIVTKEEER